MANKTIGQTTAHTDEAIQIGSGISVGSGTSVTILAAELVPEGKQPQRMLIVISVTDKEAWIKFQPASVDNDKKGIYIKKDQMLVLEASGMYFGEISAISKSSTATINVTVLFP